MKTYNYTLTFATPNQIAIVKAQGENSKEAIRKATETLREAQIKLLKIHNR